MGPTGSSRVLQIHPTRRCNLTCLHCYSSSGPRARDELEVPLLVKALDEASLHGYDYIGISGGEPLLYEGLVVLLKKARGLGMRTSITTNGMLLTPSRLAELTGIVDLIAVSLDGVPVSHNRMRGNAKAFDAMFENLSGLRESGIPFGFIFTLTRSNIAELSWVCDFAVQQGARLLQVHMLEEVGRARTGWAGKRPDEITEGYAFIEVARLQAMVGSQLYIQLDMTDTDLLRADPDRVFAGPHFRPNANPRRLADALTPVVIEPDGSVVPIQYGFGRRFALGNLRSAGFSCLASYWMENIEQDFRSLCRSIFDDLVVESFPLQNWYERLAARSRSFVPPASVAITSTTAGA